ncbi:MAG: alpha/beta hydrolase [Chloroflexota bacterium]|nr:alpha/beta hydrolase [Candidatus Binatia bacterium]
MRRRYRIILAILLVFALVLAGFVVWAETPPSPMPEAYDALKSDTQVTVSVGNWLIFTPTSSNASTGFIIYPGGRVDFRSYAPLAHSIAAEGHMVVIPLMPLNLAVFGVDIATGIIRSWPTINSWAIGGHSLGGTMAAQFAYENPSMVKGLVLWAAYPASGTDLSKSNLSVTTIHGSNDGLVSTKQIDDSLRFLPPSTVRVEIAGGNHAQFGSYGDQAGDNPATITRDSQQNITVTATVQLLARL